MTKERKLFLLWAAGLTALCLVLEGVLFQYDALRTRGLTGQALALADAAVAEEEIVPELDDVSAVMPSRQDAAPLRRVQVTFTGLDRTEVRSLALAFSGDHQLIPVTVSLSDAAYREGFAAADTLLALPGQTAYARLDAHGALYALRISFETEDASAALAAVTVNAPMPYRLRPLRFFALLLPALGVAAACCFRLWRIPFDRRRTAHRAAYLATLALCLMLVLAISALCTPFDSTRFPYTRALEYPFENSPYQYRSLTHAVMYDMLARGRISVPVEPEETLLALDNPYDPTQRLDSGAEVMFDYALKDGQYYSYFGLTPVLVFYAPFRLLTGYLPAYTTAACFFALLTAAAAFLCVWEAARRFLQHPPLLVLCLGAAAVALGSHVLMLLSCADRYHLAIASMQAFFFLTVALGLMACRQRRPGRRAALFILCALSTVLLVCSRPMGALAAAGWLAPLFVLVLRDKARTPRQKAADALCYLVPVGLGAAAVMAYNAARFGSPFEFGQLWQLTLEDIHYNRLRLSNVLPALYSYFLAGLRLSPEFPFVAPGAALANHSGNWLYAVGNAGALTLPVTWGVLLLPALRDKRRRGKLAVLLCAVLCTLPLAVYGYAIAGSAHRYACDILPTLCLAGMLALCDRCAGDASEGRGLSTALVCALCAATVFVALGLTFDNYRCFIRQYSPDRFLALYQTFTLR